MTVGSSHGARTDQHTSVQAGEALAMLAQAVLALRSTGDLGTACSIACACAVSALDGVASRLLRVDSRSGTLRLIEDSGVETPYLAEPGGPIEAVMRSECALFDEGVVATAPRETLLWLDPPSAMASVPARSSGRKSIKLCPLSILK
jgi:hypothetical protein